MEYVVTVENRVHEKWAEAGGTASKISKKILTNSVYADIVSEAWEAGNAAAQEYHDKYGDMGSCGFAWVTIPDGRSSFARYAKKELGASKHWHKGVYFWMNFPTQTETTKYRQAQAFAKVLQEAGVDCHVGSRAD